MSLLFASTCGDSGSEYEGFTGGVGTLRSNVQARTGTYSFLFDTAGQEKKFDPLAAGNWPDYAASTENEAWLNFGFHLGYFPQSPSAGDAWLVAEMVFGGTGWTRALVLYYGADWSFIILQYNPGTPGWEVIPNQGTWKPTEDTWHWLEWYHNRDSENVHDTLKADGTTRLDSADGTQAGTSFRWVAWRSAKTIGGDKVTAPAFWIDDPVWNDSAGSAWNTWVGTDIKVKLREVNGDVGAPYNDWSESNGAGTKYDSWLVTPPLRTTYLYSATDEYDQLATVENADATEDVKGVVVVAYTRHDIGGASVKFLFAESGASVTEGIGLALGGFDADDDPFAYTIDCLDAAPSGAWDSTKFNNFQVGAIQKVAGDSIGVCGMFVLELYATAAGGAAFTARVMIY